MTALLTGTISLRFRTLALATGQSLILVKSNQVNNEN